MKRILSIGAALGLLVTAVVLQPATAAPEKVVIEDPAGDANGINDQGTGDGSFGDVAPGADAGNVSDLVRIRLANDSKNLYVFFDAEGAPPATQGLGYRLRVNPDGAGGGYCILIEAFFPGATNDMTEFKAHVVDACAGGDPVEVEVIGPMVTVPRDTNKAFGKGATLTAPQAQTFVWSGSYPTGVAGPYIDTTKVGTDYKFKK
jgi:hypothetical protein